MLKLKHLSGALRHQASLDAAAWRAANGVSSRSNIPSAEVLKALEGATPRPLDAYGLAKLTGWSAMDCGRALVELELKGLAQSAEASGGANDLARPFTLCVARSAGPGMQAS